MIKLLFLITYTLALSAAKCQIIETAFFPLYDSMGRATYIKKSDVAEYKQPTRQTKIYVFNYSVDTIGCYVGRELRYVAKKMRLQSLLHTPGRR